jgi:ERCC4-type nuclease
MLIKIDTREHELFKRCEATISAVPKFSAIKLVSETLPLGDIIINDGTDDCIIIERKTLSDLSASIKDGRYEEQSYRLNGIQHHNHNIVYLIEGDMQRFNSFKERIDKQTIYSAMFSINYFKGFSVMRSNTIDETATMVCNMVYKVVSGLKAGKKGYYSNSLKNVKEKETNKDEIKEETKEETNKEETNKEETNKDEIKEETKEEINKDEIKEAKEKDYCTVVKKVKKDNITTDNIGEIMLCQIPSISSTTALAILSQFKTLPHLIKSIQEDETCLNAICTTDANGKSRKISKTAIASIIKFLKV